MRILCCRLLHDNINDLRNEKNLTFLYRVPEIRLGSLNLSTIAANYKKNLNVSDEDAVKMATLTKGYSFASQVMGYFTYRHEGDYEAALTEYRQYLLQPAGLNPLQAGHTIRHHHTVSRI